MLRPVLEGITKEVMRQVQVEPGLMVTDAKGGGSCKMEQVFNSV